MFSIRKANPIFAFLGLGFLAALMGCNSEIDPMLKTLDANVLSAKTNDISRTMDFIFDDRQFDQRDFEEKVSIGLNRWANYSSQELNEASTDDSEVVSDILKKHQDLDVVGRNDDLSFINTDPYFLQEASWISNIASRVVQGQVLSLVEYYRLAANNFKPEEDDKTPVDTLVANLHPDLDTQQTKKLSHALVLFDWTVRNIHLLPELEPTEQEIEEQRLFDDENPISAGVRFTGTQRYPWQSLMLGRGDYVDRAKIFMMLAREAGLDVAMLATGEDEKPWAVGVVIGTDYYLFDTKLGLPIPNATPGQIATLGQVKQKPELLTALNLTLEESLAEDTKYWVSEKDLTALSAQVYVVPESLSQRMNGLESSLVGEYRLALGAFPGRQLEKLPAVDGVENKLWDIGFDTHRFRAAVRKAIPMAVSDDQLNDRLRWYFVEEAYVDNFHPYRTCRVRFFQGDFEALEEDLSRNAVESFQFLNYSEEQIDNLGTDKIMMGIAGLADIKDPAEFEARLKSTQNQMRLVRRDVGYFLSQCLFDNGSPGTSANWLETIARKDDVQRWKSGITYLLGRSYESRKEYDRAIEQYGFEDSEQLHGNLIRVRMLKAAIEKAYPGAAVNAASKESMTEEADENKEESVDSAKAVDAKDTESAEEPMTEETSEEQPVEEEAAEEEETAKDEETVENAEEKETVNEEAEESDAVTEVSEAEPAEETEEAASE